MIFAPRAGVQSHHAEACAFSTITLGTGCWVLAFCAFISADFRWGGDLTSNAVKDCDQRNDRRVNTNDRSTTVGLSLLGVRIRGSVCMTGPEWLHNHICAHTTFGRNLCISSSCIMKEWSSPNKCVALHYSLSSLSEMRLAVTVPECEVSVDAVAACPQWLDDASSYFDL